MFWAQISSIITAEPAEKVTAKAGETASAKVRFKIAQGYHTNSNTPSDEYLIPLKLTWDAAPLEVKAVEYPKAHTEKYAFSDKPLSVYTGEFELTTKFAIPASALKGSRTVTGKLRYQACTDNTCYPPKTLAVTLPVEIR
ncbi:MAG: protein-disulfide reductase DsbD N-terminal domain-containing protein [Bryobacteraceae bacterium]